jgi:hypothetical protein
MSTKSDHNPGAPASLEIGSSTWLCADYHLPSTYSCRVPMSSITSALACPTPGPATVRLALIRTGIEVFGLEYVQTVLFPHIRALPLHIRPPERVALTPQVVRAYKVEEKTQEIMEAPVSREMAHAEGSLSIYLHVPHSLQEPFHQILSMIGYWGQASSLAWCADLQNSKPLTEECVRPLRLFKQTTPVQSFFASILSEFRDPQVSWNEVMPHLRGRIANPLRLDVYVWPLIEHMQHGSGKVLVRQAFPVA